MKKLCLLLALALPFAVNAAEKKVAFPANYPDDEAAIKRFQDKCMLTAYSIQDRTICMVIAEGDPGVNVYVQDDGRIIMRDERGRPVSITDDGQVVPNAKGYSTMGDMGDNNPPARPAGQGNGRPAWNPSAPYPGNTTAPAPAPVQPGSVDVLPKPLPPTNFDIYR